jgi:hypothetical protein
MSLENFLQNSWFLHIKENSEILAFPLIYVFSQSVAVNVQRLLWLGEVPHFSLIRNSKLWMNGTMLAPCSSEPMNYTHYIFTPKSQQKFKVVSSIGSNVSWWGQKIIRKASKKDFLVVSEWVWVHRKYLSSL